MNAQEILHDQIEAYLQGSLTPALKLDFEERLHTDTSLQPEVARHRKANAAIAYDRRVALKEKLKSIEAEIRTPHTSARKPMLFKRIAIAASFLVLILAGSALYIHSAYSTGAVANSLFVSTSREQFRGDQAENTVADQMGRAETFVHDGNYDQAAAIYQSLLNSDNLLQDQVEWNLLLSYYAIDSDSEQFKSLFANILADTSHDYHAQAVKLRDRMHQMFYRIVNN